MRFVDVRRLMVVGAAALLLAGCGDAATELGISPDSAPATTAGGEQPTPARDDEADTRSVAEQYAAALDTNNETAATSLTCDGTDAGALFPAFGGLEPNLPNEATKVTTVQVSGETATAELLLYGGTTTALSLARKDNRWCVSY
ncbi:hypothetical protein [Actinokineospora sp. NPDC004072]